MKKIDNTLKYELNWYLDKHLKKSKDSIEQYKEVIEILEIILDKSKDAMPILDAIPRLVQLSEGGNAVSTEATFLLGMIYRYGIGVPEDCKRAVEYFQTAVKNKHGPALSELGYCFDYGKGIDRDSIMACKLYLLSSQQGWVPSLYCLARVYDFGRGVDKNLAIAVPYYKQAAEQGYGPAENSLAVCYAEGIEVKQNFERAIELYQLAALKGIDYAQINLGVCYSNGTGVTKDKDQALYYYRLALEQGNHRAQYNLALAYYDGLAGVGLDFKRYAELCFLVASLGYPYAQYDLGTCYLWRRGVLPDLDRGVLLLLAARSKGNADSLRTLVHIYVNKDDIPNLVAFVSSFFKSAFIYDSNLLKVNEIEDPLLFKLIDPVNDRAAKSISTLAFCYQMGLVVKQNFSVGERLYLKAIEYYKQKNNLEAISRLHWDLYFCYQIQNQSQKRTGIAFDSKILSEFYERLKSSVSEGNIHDLELLAYANEKSELNLEGNWYAAVQCYQHFFDHFQNSKHYFQKELTDQSADIVLSEGESRERPEELRRRKIEYADTKLWKFKPFIQLQNEIRDVTDLCPSIAALIVAYARDTDVQRKEVVLK